MLGLGEQVCPAPVLAMSPSCIKMAHPAPKPSTGLTNDEVDFGVACQEAGEDSGQQVDALPVDHAAERHDGDASRLPLAKVGSVQRGVHGCREEGRGSGEGDQRMSEERASAPQILSGCQQDRGGSRGKPRPARPHLHTVGDDRDEAGGQAGPQHRVLLAGVGHADGGRHIRKAVLHGLVQRDGAQVRKTEQGVVGEHGGAACAARGHHGLVCHGAEGLVGVQDADALGGQNPVQRRVQAEEGGQGVLQDEGAAGEVDDLGEGRWGVAMWVVMDRSDPRRHTKRWGCASQRCTSCAMAASTGLGLGLDQLHARGGTEAFCGPSYTPNLPPILALRPLVR